VDQIHLVVEFRYGNHVKKNKANTPGDILLYRFTFKDNHEDPTFSTFVLVNKTKRLLICVEKSMDGGRTFRAIIMNGVVPPANIDHAQ
jgi:hypothetical protein